MGQIQSHRDLIVWQKAMDLAEQVYRLSESFPRVETYRLVSQIARAVVSVPANIAEGHAKGFGREFAHYLAIAKGSLMETETLLMLGVRLGYINQSESEHAFSLIVEISKMLTVLRSRVLSQSRSK